MVRSMCAGYPGNPCYGGQALLGNQHHAEKLSQESHFIFVKCECKSTLPIIQPFVHILFVTLFFYFELTVRRHLYRNNILFCEKARPCTHLCFHGKIIISIEISLCSDLRYVMSYNYFSTFHKYMHSKFIFYK